MTVNPFWFVVLMTIVTELILFLIFGVISAAKSKNDEMKDLADALSKALENGEVEVLKIDKLDGENHEDGRKDQ